MEPAPEYQRRLESHRVQAKRFARYDLILSNVRGVLFVTTIVLLASAMNQSISYGWIVVPLILFVTAMVVHEKVVRARDRATRAAAFYERGIARYEDRWIGTGEPGNHFLDAAHPYAEDLDLFGKGSLFELLCLARTQSGEQKLASWLCAPAERPVIRSRQGAVEDLRERLDFREDLAVLGTEVRVKMHPEILAQWAEQPPLPFTSWTRFACHALVLLALLCLAGWIFLSWGSYPLLLSVFLEVLMMRRIRSQVQSATRGAEGAHQELRLLSGMLERIEKEPMKAPHLQKLKDSLGSKDGQSSEQIARMGRLLGLLDWQRNQMFAPVAILLLWEAHIAFALEEWRAVYGSRIRQWLSIVGEVEALSSLACYAFEHPADPFPEITEEFSCFEAKDLGHPLIPANRTVRNDLLMNSTHRVLIVSGSNMSGKSTLLRMVGVNTVLALCGAPVRAGSLRMSTVSLGASIHILDSLQSGSSRFYAEITRLRQLMDLARSKPPLLFLLDEILHGTNSADRLAGADALVRGFLKLGAIGLLTTHDLALTQIAEKLSPPATNIHFQDHLEDGRIAFDYRIHPGVVQKSNAIALMRSVGLDV